jgi:hypothetical protein
MATNCLLNRLREAVLLLILAGASSSLSVTASATEIWMLGGTHIDHPAPGWEGLRTDAGDMWKPDAPWQTVARSVKVIQFAPTGVDRAHDSDLGQAFADLKRRNIAFAVGTGLLIRSDRFAGRFASMTFEISTKWLEANSDVKSSEADATLAEILIKLGGKFLTEFRDRNDDISQCVEIPAYFVAEWIAGNWWPLLWEPRKSEDDEPHPDFLSRHSVLTAQHGFALPRILIVPIGRSVQVSAGARNVSLADARFLNGGLETLPREEVENELRKFVGAVVARLDEKRIKETYLQDAWAFDFRDRPG